MITIDGYGITYFRDENAILVTLPPTAETATTTAVPCVDRRVDVSEDELIGLLDAVLYIFEKESGVDNGM